ncbi:MAG TPA: hypothetical protein VMX15_03120 [Candidatus Heimdallarchaeota archaeon]|nr:hypothetical protein [Candidatus Heimdallarchaeota archaeon]
MASKQDVLKVLEADKGNKLSALAERYRERITELSAEAKKVEDKVEEKALKLIRQALKKIGVEANECSNPSARVKVASGNGQRSYVNYYLDAKMWGVNDDAAKKLDAIKAEEAKQRNEIHHKYQELVRRVRLSGVNDDLLAAVNEFAAL